MFSKVLAIVYNYACVTLHNKTDMHIFQKCNKFITKE